jgi:hypothetical protein
VGSGDGLLVRDVNGDGQINSGAELFGQSTALSGGGTARDGFEALADLDTDGDGWITEFDRDFSQLKVWADSNGDGITDAGEMFTLAELGISGLSVTPVVDVDMDQGNVLALDADVRYADGSTGLMTDVWFNAVLSSGDALSNSLADALERYASDAEGTSGSGSATSVANQLAAFDENGQPVSVALGTTNAAGFSTMVDPEDLLKDPTKQSGLFQSFGQS